MFEHDLGPYKSFHLPEPTNMNFAAADGGWRQDLENSDHINYVKVGQYKWANSMISEA
jgi:hypothetical protein